MPLLLTQPTNAPDAFKRAAARDVLPSALSSREQRESIADEIRAMSVYSARTTNALYLQVVKNVIDQLLAGEMDLPLAQLTLQRAIKALGYTPEGGFPDSDVPVPPAIEGSLRDLSSFRRQDLLLKTQLELHWGAGQKMRGQDTLESWPAWELVRVIQPRGEKRRWKERFEQAGGELLDGRMVAHKNDPVWSALGDASLFSDALTVDYPPFAYNSGMRWRAIEAAEWNRLYHGDEVQSAPAEDLQLPEPGISMKELDDDMLDALADMPLSERVRQSVEANMQAEKERRAAL